ncbi:MAG: kelch repeat-containing protein [Limisphaerales bacterium]
MKNPPKSIINYCVVLVSAFFCLSAVQSLSAKEPYYKDHPLSDWICCASPDEQQEAFHHIGTNAVPILLELLGANDKSIKWVALRLESKGMREAVKDESTLADIRETVAQAFWIYGTNAEFAIPRLIKFLNKNDDDVTPYAAVALVAVGPKGFAALTNDLAMQKTSVRAAIAAGIGQNGQDAKAVNQVLISLLKDESPDVRHMAASFMRYSDEAMTALLPLLDDQDLRGWAAMSLASFGAKAKDAAPKLLSIYTNGFDRQIFGDLKRIDLETAEKAQDMAINSNPLNPFRDGYTRTELTNGLELVAGGYIRIQVPKEAFRYLSSSQLYDPKTGKWQETGEMTTTRSGHVAVLLPTGKVLVAGGLTDKGTFSSAELYDPATGKWTITGSLNKPHAGGGITLQSNGEAMIFSGGWTPSIKPFDKELYDPATGTWAEVTNQPEKPTDAKHYENKH